MIVSERIISQQLAGNLNADPNERDLFVYLPPSYGTSNRRYPTAYLLHAFGEHVADLVTPATAGMRWSPPIEDVLDPVFRRSQAVEMLVVIRDGWSKYGCSQWVDSPVNGNFEQYVTKEVVSYVDSH